MFSNPADYIALVVVFGLIWFVIRASVLWDDLKGHWTDPPEDVDDKEGK